MRWKEKVILVTGAGDFRGSHLAEELVKLPAQRAGHLSGRTIIGGWLPPITPAKPFIPVQRTGHSGIIS